MEKGTTNAREGPPEDEDAAMSQVLDGLYYSKEHLWVLVEDSVATVGITDHAQHTVGYATMVELPEDDREVHMGDEIATVQGRDDDLAVCAPVSGVVVEVNQELESNPEVVNQDPYGMGWIVKIDMSRQGEVDRLLSPEDYEDFLENEDEE